jgi:hypothetical protein
MVGFDPLEIFSGGQTAAQPPTQVTLLALSGAKVYSVRPWPLTSTVPRPGSVRVASATDELELEDGVELLAGAADELVLLELVFELLLPHAAAIKASGTSNRAGNLTRASFRVHAQRKHRAYASMY